MSRRSEAIEEIGRLGELLVRDNFISLGHKVVMSEDKYDTVKDMTVDGVNVEVKTEMPLYIKDAFTISSKNKNQLPKCLSVDRLVFVVVPADKNIIYSSRILNEYHFDRIEIREAPDKKDRKYFEHILKNQKQKRYCFPLGDTKLLTYVKRPDIVDIFKTINVSAWS